jgi:uncharacterized membrane protein
MVTKYIRMIWRAGENYRRTVIKTLTYRAFVTLTSYVVLLLLSGSQAVALAFTGLSIIYSTGIYFLHERAWAHIDWGLKK